MFDFDSDKLIKTFLNSGDAARNTGISERTICQQVQNGVKPGRKRSEVYFLSVRNKKKKEKLNFSAYCKKAVCLHH